MIVPVAGGRPYDECPQTFEKQKGKICNGRSVVVVRSLGRLRKKAMLGLAFLAIIQYPDIRVRPASRRIKKAPSSKAEAQFIQARNLSQGT